MCVIILTAFNVTSSLKLFVSCKWEKAFLRSLGTSCWLALGTPSSINYYFPFSYLGWVLGERLWAAIIAHTRTLVNALGLLKSLPLLYPFSSSFCQNNFRSFWLIDWTGCCVSEFSNVIRHWFFSFLSFPI